MQTKKEKPYNPFIIIPAFLVLTLGLIVSCNKAYSDFSDQDVSGDIVVTDHRTGLEWEVKTSGNKSTPYTWQQAIDYCETTMDGYAGHSDWRLPNINELQSLVDVDKESSPLIDTTYFPNCQSSSYWSSTTYAPSTGNAWRVGFNDGFVDYYSKTDDYYVRCCRD